MEIRVVQSIALKAPATIQVVNIETFEIAPLILPARKRHNNHGFLVRLIVVIKVKRKFLGSHYHEHEIVRSCTLPHPKHLEHVPRRHGKLHHLRKGSPGGSGTLQSEEAAHDVIPHFVNPEWRFFPPPFRVVLRRKEKADSV